MLDLYRRKICDGRNMLVLKMVDILKFQIEKTFHIYKMVNLKLGMYAAHTKAST